MTSESTSKAGSICVSLEWAKKMKEAGWPQTCVHGRWFYHAASDGIPHVNGTLTDFLESNHAKSVYSAAPTAEEILRRLPDNIQMEVSNYSGLKKRFSVSVSTSRGIELPKGIAVHVDEEDSLANAAAAMYCYLAENNLLPS